VTRVFFDLIFFQDIHERMNFFRLGFQAGTIRLLSRLGLAILNFLFPIPAMAFMKSIAVLAILLALVSISFAGCASSAYSKTCASCSFDQYGKVDQSCSKGYQNSGTACVSATYPIMSGKYALGQCPGVDSCADELRSCTAQMGSGNDKEDCTQGSMEVCYAAADQCVRSAAVKCGEVEGQTCDAPAGAVFLLFIGMGYVAMKKEGERKR
jgi:hypothetical protein